MLILVYITFHFTIVTGFLGILPDIVPLRTTKYGPVIGFIKDLNETAFIHAYLGIPYAKPPIGNLRFKAPQPPNTWTEPLWCRKWKPKCYRSFSAFEVPQSEDCLYLNVFTGPKCVDVEQCPVLVYLHGGELHE